MESNVDGVATPSTLLSIYSSAHPNTTSYYFDIFSYSFESKNTYKLQMRGHIL